jgi:mannose-6-phosphate isomerase-like protein (cupin superfamily)
MARVIERTAWAASPDRAHGDWEGGDANVSIIFHETVESGKGPQLHTHPYAETFVIEVGRARFTVGDEVIEAGAGQILVVPPETPHKFETLGPLRSIHIHASPRFVTRWLD